MSSGPPPDIPGDPDRVQGLARSLSSAGGRAIDIQMSLAQQGLESWIGAGGEQYRSKLGEFHPHLSSVGSSLSSVGSAMTSYATSLADRQSAARVLATNIYETQQRISSRMKDSATSQWNANSAKSSADGTSDPSLKSYFVSMFHDANSAVDAAERDIEQWGKDLEDLFQKAWNNFGAYLSDAENCAKHVVSETEELGEIMLGASAAAVKLEGKGLSALLHGGERFAGKGLNGLERGAAIVGDAASKEIDDHWKGIHTILAYSAGAVAIVGGVAASFVVGPEAGFAGAALASALIDGAQTAGDFYVARGSNTDRTTRIFAKDNRVKDAVSTVTTLATAVVPLAKPGADIDPLSRGLDGAVTDIAESGDKDFAVRASQAIDYGMDEDGPGVEAVIDSVKTNGLKAGKDLIAADAYQAVKTGVLDRVEDTIQSAGIHTVEHPLRTLQDLDHVLLPPVSDPVPLTLSLPSAALVQ